jgi:hypothetical protein
MDLPGNGKSHCWFRVERLRGLFREIRGKARFRRRLGRHDPAAAQREHQANFGHQLARVQRDRQTLRLEGCALSGHDVQIGRRPVAVPWLDTLSAAWVNWALAIWSWACRRPASNKGNSIEGPFQ